MPVRNQQPTDSPSNAIAALEQAARLNPNDVAIHRQLGQALTAVQRDAEAITVFQRVLDRVPDDPTALVGFGLAAFRTGNTAAAEPALRRCIAQHPAAWGASLVLGTLLGHARRFSEAEGVMRACIAVHPKNGQAWQLLGNSLHRQGRLRDAEQAYRKTLEILPQDYAVWDQLGDVLIRLDDIPAAEDALRRATALNPNAPEPFTNLGRIQEMRGDLDGAIALHDRSLAAAPQQSFAYLNRGNARRFKGDFTGALADFDAALAVDPAMPEAIGCRGFTLLTLGCLQDGWPAYEARIAGQPGAFAPTDATGWDGSPLAGKRIVVWTEYGLGDEIMFASLLPELAVQAAHCTVLCEPRLVTLFRRSFPGITVAARGSDATGTFDLKFALADAARWLRPSMTAFPKHGGYLTVDPARVAQLVSGSPPGLRVGISWRSTSATTGPFKTTRLADWAPILSVPGVSFHSLQYGDVTDEIAGTSITVDPSIDPMADLNGFAAQVAAMDLVISVSNTTVHFAGALGKPVWTLVPEGQGAHWYWFRERDDSPWYPSMRLFRQPASTDWAAVMTSVATQLRARAAA